MNKLINKTNKIKKKHTKKSSTRKINRCTYNLKRAIVNPSLKMCLTSASFQSVIGKDITKSNLFLTIKNMLNNKSNKDKNNYNVVFLLDARSSEKENFFPYLKNFERFIGDYLVDMAGMSFDLGFDSQCIWIKNNKKGCLANTTITNKEMEDKILNADIIYGLGGDPCDFMNTFKMSSMTKKLLNIMIKRINMGKVIYIGRSAGAMITGHKILSNDQACKGKFENGMNILPNIVIRPHVDGNNHNEIIEKFCKKENNKLSNKEIVVVKLTDNEFLKVNNGKIHKLTVS